MSEKTRETMMDGTKLSDAQLDGVIGGVTLPADQASAKVQPMAVAVVGKPIFRK